jgi:hypothetical protein
LGRIPARTRGSGILHESGGVMGIEKVVAALLLLASPALMAASVDGTNRIPEPETLALFGGAALAWAIVRWIKRK